MKILVLGTIDNKGGAALISWEIRKRLKAAGHSVTTLVRYKYSKEPDVIAIPRKRYQDWLVKLFANDLRFARTDFIFDMKEYKEADIVHCHNLHSNFFNLKDLARMSAEKPVVWTMHDIWAITGFASTSGERAHPHKKRFLLKLWDNTPRLLALKKRIYARSKLHVVAVSDWLRRELSQSILGSQDISLIYNGIDATIFKPQDKSAARRALGLPLDKKLVGFGIKGYVDVAKVIDASKDRDDMAFVSIGHSHLKGHGDKVISIDYTESKQNVAQLLSALDAFLYPTTGDTFGLIVAEAQACGVPVITYDVDALPEIVTHKETGYVAERANVADMKNGLDYVLGLTPEAYAAMSAKATERSASKFSLERMYKEYLALYKRLLGDRQRN